MNERYKIIADLYTAGLSFKQISLQLNCEEGIVNHVVHRLGLPRRGRTGRPSNYTGNETEVVCNYCKKLLPLSAYGKGRPNKGNRPVLPYCKACMVATRMKRDYGFSLQQYTWTKTQNCHCCGIAPEAAVDAAGRGLFIDHDHKTGKYRGVLCEPCNSAIGLSNDSTERCNQLIDYLNTCFRSSIPSTDVPVSISSRRAAHLRRNFNLSIQQFSYLYQHKAGACHACLAPLEANSAKACIDHDHASGQVRGLLCWHCNMALGKFKDNPETMRKAITYLTSPPIQPPADPVEPAPAPEAQPPPKEKFYLRKRLPIDKVIELYNSGMTCAAISRQLGISGVSAAIIKAGIPRRSHREAILISQKTPGNYTNLKKDCHDQAQ